MKDLKYLLAYTVPLSAYVSFESTGIWTYSAVFYAFIVLPVSVEGVVHFHGLHTRLAQKNPRLSGFVLNAKHHGFYCLALGTCFGSAHDVVAYSWSHFGAAQVEASEACLQLLALQKFGQQDRSRTSSIPT